MLHDVAIIGGGIVGLSVGKAVLERAPAARLVVLEKEPRWAAHQSGRNSGVVHSGIYYPPGSAKANWALDGSRALPAFCARYGVPYRQCGKLIVATGPAELPALARLEERGRAHGLAVRMLGPAELREREPHAAGLAALLVASTGITDYARVADAYAAIIAAAGGELRTGCRVTGFDHRADRVVVETTQGTFEARFVVGCAGLGSDRVARMGGVDPGVRIVPFRGENFSVVAERRDLVQHLIYPVPDPAFPFLGVHFTRDVAGGVHCGPNAVLAFAREGYRWSDVVPSDVLDWVAYPGFWRLARRHWRSGMGEMLRSASKRAFTARLRRLVPEVEERDLVPAASGVRAQALRRDGSLVDDFLIVRGARSIHVCNAPSPAATASLPIGRAVAAEVPLPGLRS